jgi:Rad3-related DNA helicase
LDIPQPNILELIPLKVDKIFPKIAADISEKNLLMSATIINPEKSLQLLGLNPNNSEYIEVDSNFPIENRKVFFMNAVNLNYKTMKDNKSADMVNTIDICKEIVSQHSKTNESGFIFAPSYHLCNKIYYNLKDTFKSLGYTVLFNKDSDFKDEILNKFLNQKKKSILISPSFSEGVNFSDDVSRFQIIVKTPFASLSSNYIKTKMNREKD